MIKIAVFAGKVENIGCLDRIYVLEIYLAKDWWEYLVVDLDGCCVLFRGKDLGLVQEDIFVLLEGFFADDWPEITLHLDIEVEISVCIEVLGHSVGARNLIKNRTEMSDNLTDGDTLLDRQNNLVHPRRNKRNPMKNTPHRLENLHIEAYTRIDPHVLITSPKIRQ